MANQICEAAPCLRVRDASAAIEFYKLAFGAIEEFRYKASTELRSINHSTGS